MKIEIQSVNKKAGFASKAAIKKAISAGINMYGDNRNIVVYVALCDDDYIKDINAEHRHKDTATDVLSFPLIEWDKPLDWDSLKMGEDINPEDNSIELGDIIISMDAVARQAEEYGHSQKRELCYLSVHGLMHLMGYDHMTDDDKREMRKAEEAVMEKIKQVR